MGKVELTIDGKKITIDWTSLSDQQLEFLGKSYNYPLQIDDPEHPGTLIDNTEPVMVFVLTKMLQMMSDNMRDKYISENMDGLKTEAEAVADITPNGSN